MESVVIFYNKQVAITINLLVYLLPFFLLFMFFIFNAPNKVKENLNIYLFQALLYFYIHCAVSYFGSVLWLKQERGVNYCADTLGRYLKS